MSVYINHSKLPNQVIKNTALHICNMIEKIVPGQTLGGKVIRGVWSVWLRSIRAKCYLSETIRDPGIGGVKLSMHDTYPISKPIPNEKVLFRDLPQHVSNNGILEFLNDQPGILVKSGVIFSRLRDSDNKQHHTVPEIGLCM